MAFTVFMVIINIIPLLLAVWLFSVSSSLGWVCLEILVIVDIVDIVVLYLKNQMQKNADSKDSGGRRPTAYVPPPEQRKRSETAYSSEPERPDRKTRRQIEELERKLKEEREYREELEEYYDEHGER